MSGKVQVRVERKLLEQAREEYPEYEGVSDTDLVDILLRKQLKGGNT